MLHMSKSVKPSLSQNEVNVLGMVYRSVLLNKSFVKSAYQKIIFLFFDQNISYVVGAQKNRLNETVLVSTQNIC